ncbi:MAG: right-handed parallel beta-helix repeat-containing protein, partial [Thermoplasmata archaeon]|nr:right-handed parallel beta-helix repeat-containing protein [Thermoplasmata archaeon]
PYAESDPVLTPGPAGEWDDFAVFSPDVLYDGANYHMWYSGHHGGTTYRIGHATNSYIDADFLSIQNAIEFAGPDATILVHPGKYNEKLLINKSLTLQSTDGWQNTNIDPVGDSIIWIEGEVDVTVQGFEITSGTHGIYIPQVFSTVNILDCFIHGNDIDGIHVTGSGDVLNIERNIISDNGSPGCGIYMSEAWSTTNIRNNIVGGEPLPSGYTHYRGNDGDGIRVDNVPTTAHVVIEENHINANDDDGIDLAPDSSVEGSVNIKNNVIALALIMHCGGTDERRGNQDDGIHIGEVSDTGRIIIEGNKISENGAEGIDFGQGAGTMFGNVLIRENLIGGWTYYPEDPGAPVRYYGNGDEGIYIFQVGDSGRVSIMGNKISENARVFEDTGIRIQHIYGAVNVAGNDIGAWEDEHGESYLGNEGQGLLVADVFSGGELTIGPDNSIEENTGHGIEVAYGALDATIEIHGNLLNDNDPVACGCGIKLGSGGVYGAIVSDNIITKHHEGIRLAENSQKNTVQYNEIS